MAARGQRLHFREKSEEEPLATDCALPRIPGVRSKWEDPKKTTGCLLGACSGRQPVAYCFSLLTLCFQEY